MIEVEVQIASPDWASALPGVKALVRQAARGLAADGEAAVLLTDDREVGDLNARFRRRETPTNVLSFPAPPNPEGHLGDIALAFGVCRAEARTQGKPLADHLRHLVVHGLLHLLGYDHVTEAQGQEMETLERDILGAMGIPDPYAPELHELGSDDNAGQDRPAGPS